MNGGNGEETRIKNEWRKWRGDSIENKSKFYIAWKNSTKERRISCKKICN